ncbi:MAG: hypothetical protein ACKPKO_42850, partial [Candidatus Fonsibacter sp.]
DGNSWVDITGAFAMTVQQAHPAEGTPKNPPRVLVVIDFNVPNLRDALTLPHIAQAVATIFNNVGPEFCALLAHMPAFAKEDSSTDPLDDEVTLKQVFYKAGFCAQQRVWMHRIQPASIESTLRIGDWHVDSRLMYLASNDMAARGDTKTQQGKCWRMKSELARTTQIAVRPAVPTPQEMLQLTSSGGQDAGVEFRWNKEDKVAQ